VSVSVENEQMYGSKFHCSLFQTEQFKTVKILHQAGNKIFSCKPKKITQQYIKSKLENKVYRTF